jgi:hypothetical protein
LKAKTAFIEECWSHVNIFKQELKRRTGKSKGRQFVATPTSNKKAKKARKGDK